ncbi:T-cell activation inhibitor, mitochondrial isoform X3 [Pectinophora gossypiella]|uniref:T-cell activation inhibitor, mitochondrial isoform X3 n=1 Tax=Pectinophora gossypiella TaxID=13191 RepID=UPI00214E22B1|nr:T-cell activation inhibitor, mitochondrial isoform X3 [Pectinophora gossypiella]
MYTLGPIKCKSVGGIVCRYLSSAEISTALRPFYFSVHPDLFGKYPQQRKTNENSLQQLSALIEAQQSSRNLAVPPLPFYLRQKDKPDGDFKLVKIHLNSRDVRETLVKVLSACDISTHYVEAIPRKASRTVVNNRKPDFSSTNQDFASAHERYSSSFESAARMKRKVEERRAVTNIVDWIHENSELAKEKYESTKATRNQVQTLINELRTAYGRTIALGQFTGVSLDGDVFLSIIDVRNEWLSLIKKVSQEDGALAMIPNYEKTLSSVLRDIHIRRRKFMPKVSATQYCNHLRQLITSIGDFYGNGQKFPSTVPDSLSKYEIVVEPEAGPLMVSPTGQFITPSSCPASELINFIAKNLDEATLHLTEYSINKRLPCSSNKHVEKALHKEVKERFGLLELHKDDSITPGLMILCCQRLLTQIDTLDTKLRGNILYITHYYSVLTEGALCIPWNFK